MTTATDDLIEKIKDLNFILQNDQRTPGDSDNAKDIAENVKLLCEEILPTSADFSYFLSLLFSNEENGLFFVAKQMLRRYLEFENALCSCIDSFSIIVFKAEANLQQYVSDITSFCLKIIKQESLKAKREYGYNLLISILELAGTSGFDDEQLHIEEIIKFLYAQLETIKRSDNNSAKKGLLHLIGILCKQFSQNLEHYRRNFGQSLASVLTAELKNQIGSNARAPHYGVLEGCFVGFDGFLYSFNDILTDPSAKITLRQLYDFCKLIIDPENHITRHAPHKAALSLLINHSYLFREYFFLEFKALYNYFQSWALHSDRDLRGFGFKGIDTLLLRVSELLPERLAKNAIEGQHVYKFFVDKFSHSMANSVGVREIAIAVKGLGYFAEATKTLHSNEGLLILICGITTRSENVFLNSPEPVEQKITYVPQFLEAAANTLMFCDEVVPNEIWLPLETIHSLLYQYFPLLDKKYFLSAISASCRLFVASCARNTAYLDRVIRQFLLRLFSLVPASVAQSSDANQDISMKNRDPKNFTYKDYLPLWLMLLDKSGINDLDAVCVSELRSQIFDGLIKICIDLISRLELEAHKVSLDDEENSEEFNPSSQPLRNLQPKKRNDFCIFINLVDFLRDLLTSLKSKMFEKWIATFVRVVIEFSTKYPLVSGFYKLLTLAMSLGNDLNYFQSEMLLSEARQTLDLISRYIEEMLIRLRQFKDDLLVSCLELILKIPSSLVNRSIASLSEAVKTSLKLGLTYLPLTETCMDALELWDTVLPVNDLIPLYQEILPSLDEYLNSEQVVEPDYATNEVAVEKSISRRKRKKGFDKKKILDQKMFASKSMSDNSALYETKLTNVRGRILLFIGRLGGQINHCLIGRNQEQLAELCTAWDTVEHLTFDIPFPDMKPTIVLDKFLPRICTLAVSSGDRKTKIAACESLHSIVLYVLGKNSQQNEQQRQKYQMHRIYRRLFPVLLQLCCDADEVPKGLFRLLVNQIVHWFTSNRSFENPETVALLESLLEGAENFKDANIRDFSAQCVNEFMKWSIKHSTGDKGDSPAENNVKSLFQRMCSLASHPSTFKRLAASLLFNAVYRTFREETSLVNKYFFQLLTVYLNSLALASHDDESEGTTELCVEVVGHLERIVMKKHELFLKLDATRILPMGWSESTMECCVRWLFDQIGRTPMMFRQKCVELFEKLSPYVVTFGGPKPYFNSVIKKHGVECLIKRFEGFGNTSFECGISKWPSLELNENLHMPDVLRWFDCLLTALDCYFVALTDSLVESDVLFSGNGVKHSNVFISCSFYLDKVVGSDLNEIFKNSSVLTPKEQKLFYKSNCTVFVRLLQFYTALLNKSSDSLLKNLPTSVWPDSLFLHCLTCCFNPVSLGFDLTMKETVINLPTILYHWIVAMSRRSPTNVKTRFSETLSTLLSGVFKFPSLEELLTKESSSLHKTDWFFAENVSKAYSLLYSCNVLPKNFCPDGSEMWRSFVNVCTADDSVEKCSFAREWSPAAMSFTKSYLKLASEIGIKATDVAISLSDSTIVKLTRSSSSVAIGSLTTRGSILLGQFDESISLIAAKNPKSFLSSLISLNDKECFGEILCRILEVFIKDAKIRHSYGEKFVKTTAETCQRIFFKWTSFSDQSDSQRLKSLWISIVQKLATIHSSIFTKVTPISDEFFNCFLKLLTHKTTNLSFKNKALLLLGVFGECRTDERDANLKRTLNEFTVRDFPFKSTEFVKNSQECDDYLTAIRRMMLGLSVCHNPIILEVLVNLLCRENEHIAEEEITTLLRAYSNRSVTAAHYETVISVPYNIFWNETGDYSDEHRLNVLEKLLLPMLIGLDLKLLKQFFIARLQNLITSLESPFKHTIDAVYRNQLISKLGSFNLLELMYTRLDVTILKGEINDKFVGKISQDKTELLKKLIVLSQDARKEGKLDSTLSNLKWRFRCSAHNCLVAVLTTTQTKAAFFERYVFKDAWDCIIDSGKQYSFDIDVGFVPNKQRQILSVRRISDDSSSQDSENDLPKNSNTLQFLSSQFLADSSLRSELSNFDFTGSLVSSSVQSYENSNKKIDPGSSQQPSHVSSSSSSAQRNSMNSMIVENIMEMEMDELNKHPCMKITISVIKFLVNKNITPIEMSNPGEMPIWMTFLLKQLQIGDINTKLFVARVITLLDKIFLPFAKYFQVPLIQLIIDPDCGPVGLHLFRIDVLSTLLSWSTVSAPEKTDLFKRMCNALLEYLMTHVTSSNTAILRRNIRFLNVLLQLWKDCFEVDPNILFKYLNNVEQNLTEISVGLQLLGVLLGNNANPLGRYAGAEKAKILHDRLCSYLGHQTSRIYKVSAEDSGLYLKFSSDHGNDVLKFEDDLQRAFSKTLQDGAKGKGKFLECLHVLQKHYPKFAQRFVKDVLNLLPSVQGQYKAHCLAIILGQAADITNLFEDLKTRGLKTLLVIRDESRQLLTLGILKEIVDKLKFNNIRDIIPEIFSFPDHPNEECRKAAAEIYCHLYDLWSEEGTEDSKIVTDNCRECLLKLLNDSEHEVRQTVYNFWSHETRLSADTAKRLSKILSVVYSPNTERDFLSHATYLLLELTSKSTDFKKDIFDKPLTECKFEDLNIVTSWRRRYTSLQTPAFADTQLHSAVISTQDTSAPNQLRATMGLLYVQFTQTQIDGKTYDWMTGSGDGGGTYDTLAVESFGDNSANAQNGDDFDGLLFAEKSDKFKYIRTSGISRSTRQTLPGGDFKNDSAEANRQIRQLQRRILKDRNTERFAFARMNTQRQQLREKKAELIKKNREERVSLYRKYRVGDFPDIQIPHSAIITPLQAVAKHDSIIAGYLFESLMSAIYSTLRKEYSESTLTKTTKCLANGVEEILIGTSIYYRPLISSILLFIYNNVDSIRVKVEEIKNSAIMSRQQQLGVIVLEKMLMFGVEDFDSKPPEKRSRKTKPVVEDEEKVSIWINLLNNYYFSNFMTYKSLDDRENVRVIFSHHLNSKEETKLALDMEAHGQLAGAVDLYSNALRQSDEDSRSIIEQAEADFWEESRLQCLNDLNDWNRLADVTERTIDGSGNGSSDLYKIWTDPYLQDFCLPFLLKSKLKLIIDGNDEILDSINNFIQRSTSKPDQRMLLQERHAFSLALIDYMKGDYQKAIYECKNFMTKLLKDWASLTAVDIVAKKHLLHDSQRLAEMTDFLKFQEQKNSIEFHLSILANLMDNWVSHSPNLLSDSVSVWDDVITQRTLFVTRIIDQISTSADSTTKKRFQDETILRETRVKMQYAQSATLQRNFQVAFAQLESAKRMVNLLPSADSTFEITSKFCGLYAEAHFLHTDIMQISEEDSALRLLNVLDLCSKFENKSKKHFTANSEEGSFTLIRGRTFEKLGHLLYKSKTGFVDFSNVVVEKIKSSMLSNQKQHESISWDHAAGMFYSLSFELYKKSWSTCTEVNTLQPVVDFCDIILRQIETGLNETCTLQQLNVDAYVQCFVESLLKSMSLGSTDSRRMFPRLLQILEISPSCSQLFVKMVESVPDWMFLGWLNQIVAVLDKSYGVCLNGIVEKIADNYPQALVYPLMLSLEGFKFTKENSKQQSFVNGLEKTVTQLPLVKKFVDNLVLLSHPHASVKDAYSEIYDMFGESRTKDELKDFLKRQYRDLFLSGYDETCLGDMWKKYIKNFKEKFDKLVGNNCTNLINCSSQEVQKMFEPILKDKELNQRLPDDLNLYSTWLAEFGNQNYGNILEIPGQYTGDKKPIPSQHVYVQAFESQVKIFSSLRHPKSITIRGNDGNEYKYIVKCGEDLRQDQRIMQIFKQMNGILANDYQCSAKSLSIRTYTIVPLTTKVGLIEIMPNVDTFKEFIERFDNYTAHFDKRYVLENFYGNKFFDNMGLDDVLKDCYKAYCSSYSKVDHGKAADCFLKAQRAAPKFLIRNAMLRLCSSPEAFYVLRNRFSMSHAVLCTAHYILGVGDRHLGNLMIDTTSATVVGIDFGYVFGTSVQLLPIPELMPFRLTKQILGVFEPIGVHGLAESVMRYCMRAFRENGKLLLNTMDVFVKEPALNWLKEAVVTARRKNVKITKSVDLTWYPKQKIDTVSRKLNGDNPVLIMEQELRQTRTSQTVKFPLEKVVDVVYGYQKIDKNKPRGYAKDSLSVEDQIACLIDMATDPVILARVYYGWEPWI